LFVSGPYDDSRRIVAQLVRSVGEGNFHFLIGGPAEELDLPEDVVRSLDDAARREGR
jgi:hypothetical protein